MIDFQSLAFVWSGNAILMLSTNTPAITLNGIRLFWRKIAACANDMSVLMQRRLQKVVNDRQRTKVIDLWTNPPPISLLHEIKLHYPPVVCGGIPRSVLHLGRMAFELQTVDDELIVCLPCPAVLHPIVVALFRTPLDGRARGGGYDLQRFVAFRTFGDVHTSAAARVRARIRVAVVLIRPLPDGGRVCATCGLPFSTVRRPVRLIRGRAGRARGAVGLLR
jgi:hypothetical protein